MKPSFIMAVLSGFHHCLFRTSQKYWAGVIDFTNHREAHISNKPMVLHCGPKVALQPAVSEDLEAQICKYHLSLVVKSDLSKSVTSHLRTAHYGSKVTYNLIS